VLEVYRIEKERYASVAYHGTGGLYVAGRWHRRGAPVAYAAEHPAVAAMEKLVWLGSYEEAVASAFVVVPLRLDPERHLRRLSPPDLPEDWEVFPHPPSTQALGARWLREGGGAVLEVPSAVVSGSKNYLINPLHPSFRELEVGDPYPYRWDARLFKRPSNPRGRATGG
jgi:RES domain-containing protein